MDYTLSNKKQNKVCLIIVGGFGDKGDDYSDLVDLLKHNLPSLAYCTFTLTQVEKDIDTLLYKQAEELEVLASTLLKRDNFSKLILYTSSMGAFATTMLVTNPKFSKYISHVLYFDPADYYLTGNVTRPSGSITWAGHESYKPNKPTASSLLKKLQGNIKVNVIHFTIKNYGPDGYCTSNLIERGKDWENGCTRLSTDMVKNFYENIPIANKGKYLEVSNLPHGYFRDGDIKQNIQILTNNIVSLINNKIE